MFNIKRKKSLINFRYNVEHYKDELYTFGIVPIYNSKEIYYDGVNNLYKYGLPITNFSISFPVVNISDIAYKKDDKYYEILTNREVKPIEMGYTKIKENILYASQLIHKADLEDLNDFYNYLVTCKLDLKQYLKNEKKYCKRKN